MVVTDEVGLVTVVVEISETKMTVCEKTRESRSKQRYAFML